MSCITSGNKDPSQTWKWDSSFNMEFGLFRSPLIYHQIYLLLPQYTELHENLYFITQTAFHETKTLEYKVKTAHMDIIKP